MNSLQINVNLSFQQLVEVIKQLSPKERLKLHDVIWNDDTDIPSEHQQIVLDRIQKSKETPNRMLDWEEASKKLIP
jgi:hypothetical protein